MLIYFNYLNLDLIFLIFYPHVILKPIHSPINLFKDAIYQNQ
jgi:hypothetical protein